MRAQLLRLLTAALAVSPMLALAAPVTVNSTGGTNNGNGLAITLGDTSQLQIKRVNVTTLNPQATVPTAATQPNLFNGVWLAVGSVVVGPNLNAGSIHLGPGVTVQEWTPVSNTLTAQLPAGSGTATQVLKATVGGQTYVLRVTYGYFFPAQVVTVTYRLDVPAGNASMLRLYHFLDAALASSNTGTCFADAATPRSTGVFNAGSTLQSFWRAEPGTTWTGGFAGLTSCALDSTSCGALPDNSLFEPVDFTSVFSAGTVDNGYGVMWNLGTPAGTTVSKANALVFQNLNPSVSVAFGAPVIASAATTTLTFYVRNDPANAAHAGLAFSNQFPAGLTLANTTVTNTCGGTVTQIGGAALAVGATSVRLAGGAALAAGVDTCAVTVNVTSATPGSYVETFASITAVTNVVSAISSQTLVVRPAAPVVTLDSPSTINAANVATWAVSGSCLDADGAVTVTVGSFVKSLTCLGGLYFGLLDVSSVADSATVSVSAAQTNGSGTTTASAVVAKDTAAPTAPVISTPGSGSATNDTTPDFTGTGEVGATVTVREGAVTLCTAVVSGAGAWTCTSSALGQGSHTGAVTQTDVAANTSAAATTTFTVDTAAPAAPTITAPTNNSFLATATPTFSGAGEIGATVSVKEGAVVVCTGLVGAGATWSCVASPALATGAHSVRATQQDPAGNTSGQSGAINFTIDTTAPAAPVVNNPANASFTNDTTPNIGGFGEAGATVTVVEGATTLCTAVVPAGLTWTCTSSALAAGSHTVTATQKDAAGNVSPVSNSEQFTIDTGAPAVPVFTAPANNAVLTTATPTFSGTGEVGATVFPREAGAVACSVVVPAGGAWSCVASPAIADGVHVFFVNQRDAAGNMSPNSANHTVTIDATPPATPTISAPVDGAALANAKPVFSGTAEANSTVTISDGPTTVCTATASAGGAWTCTPATALAEGAHAVDATAKDAAGNMSSATVISITIDTVAPVAPSITTPAAGGAIGVPTTFTGTAEAGASVTVKEGATTLCSAVASGSGAWSCASTSTLSEASHTVTATQRDAAGNVSPASAGRTFTVDATPPGVPGLSGPLPGETVSSSTPTFTGSGEVGSTVTVRVGGVSVCTALVDSSGSFSCTASAPLADGTQVATAFATDAAGNQSGVTGAQSFTIDSTPPAAPVLGAPDAGSTVLSTSVVFGGTAEPGALVAVSEGSTTLCSGQAAGSGVFSCSATPGDGSHTVVATAVDSAGNTSAASASLTFVVDAAPPLAPVVSTPADGATTSNATPTFSGTGKIGATVTVTEGSTTLCTATVASDNTWSCASAALSDGSHAVTVSQVDLSGRTSPTTALSVVIDHTPPAAPSITTPVAGVTVAVARGAMSGTGESGATVTVTEGGTTLCTAVVDGTGRWTCTPSSALPDGTHSLVATQTDAAGNTGPGSAALAFTVDTTAPAAPSISAPASGDVVATGTPLISGLGEAAATVSVKSGGFTLCTATVATGGAWSCRPVAALTGGVHVLVPSQKDVAGNTSPDGPTVSLTIDLGGPAAPVIATPAENAVVSPVPVFSGTALSGSLVSLSVDGATVASASADSSGAWSVTAPTSLTEGPHVATAKATDALNRVSPESAARHFSVALSTQGVEVIVTSPTDGATVDGDAVVAITGTATLGAKVSVFVDAATVGSVTASADGTFTVELPAGSLSAGVHEISASARVFSGQSSSVVRLHVTATRAAAKAGGCGCADAPSSALWPLALVVALALSRRRTSPLRSP